MAIEASGFSFTPDLRVAEVSPAAGGEFLSELIHLDDLATPDGSRLPADVARSYLDFVRLHLQTGDPLYRRLFAATLRKLSRNGGAGPEEQRSHALQTLAVVRARTLDALRGTVPRGAVDRVASLFEDVRRSLAAADGKPFRALLIGDCLFQDILVTLEEECLEDGVQLQTSFIDTKNPAQARQQVANLPMAFDAVFFSPLSYEQSLPFRQVLEWRKAALSGAAYDDMIGQTLHEIDVMVGLLTAHAECPVFVHNTAAVRRHDGGTRDVLKNALTLPLRRRARDQVNAGIVSLLDRHRTTSAGALNLIDETRLLEHESEDALGRFLFWSPLNHPAALGFRLATAYRDRIQVMAHLLGRKVVVSDLDNTLWHGITGEGAVRHDLERQAVLRRLRERGVLLAINSKNDPARVDWSGAALGPDDFVHSEINWNLKAENMRRIQKTLNIRFEDFVFVDDQADQREMVRLTTPQVRLLDANDPRNWRLLGLWADLLVADPETDRTTLYRQREQRQRFVDAQSQAGEAGDLFSRLDIQVRIREAETADLRRAAELINRTNQFNTCGSRTTLQELTAWRAASNRHLLLVESSDKFGSNGTVAVMMLETSPEELRIPCFVLSCRVFGFGIEDALINHVKRSCRIHDGQPIIGLFTATSHNGPCRDVYPRNGFAWEGERWIFGQGEAAADPPWLTVHAPRPTRRT